jgi:AbrB family looped-hinge helix DNA binding protein
MYALGSHIPLLKRGIRIGALHIYTSRQPPVLANRWTADGDARRRQRTVLGNADIIVAVVRVTRNYQITIPAEVRRRLGIKVGDRVLVEVEGDRIVIRKASGGLPRIRLGLRLTPGEIDKLVVEGAARGGS